MEHKKTDDHDIIRFSLDIWEETGLIARVQHPAGTFYYSDYFPTALEFNFFVPAFDQTMLPPATLNDIAEFYKSRGRKPALYCPDGMIATLDSRAGNLNFREVIMRANIDDVITRLEQKTATPASDLFFRKLHDFSDPAYTQVYNRVFLSPDSTSQYDEVYKTFIDMFNKAAKGGVSFSPWVVLGSLKENPASSATIVMKKDMAGLYNLATKPEFRNRNLSNHTMLEAFRLAKGSGAQTLFLITETGSKLEETYKRIGFHPLAYYSGITLKP